MRLLVRAAIVSAVVVLVGFAVAQTLLRSARVELAHVADALVPLARAGETHGPRLVRVNGLPFTIVTTHEATAAEEIVASAEAACDDGRFLGDPPGHAGARRVGLCVRGAPDLRHPERFVAGPLRLELSLVIAARDGARTGVVRLDARATAAELDAAFPSEGDVPAAGEPPVPGPARARRLLAVAEDSGTLGVWVWRSGRPPDEVARAHHAELRGAGFEVVDVREEAARNADPSFFVRAPAGFALVTTVPDGAGGSTTVVASSSELAPLEDQRP